MTMIHPNQCGSRSNLIQPRYKLGSPCDLQYIHGTKKFSFEKNANNVEIKKHLKNVLVRQKTRKKSTQKTHFYKGMLHTQWNRIRNTTMDPAKPRNLRTVPVSPPLSLFSTRFCRNSPRFSPQSPKNGVNYKFLFKLMFHRRFWLFGKENKTCPLNLALVGSQIQTKPSCVMSSNQITKPNQTKPTCVTSSNPKLRIKLIIFSHKTPFHYFITLPMYGWKWIIGIFNI